MVTRTVYHAPSKTNGTFLNLKKKKAKKANQKVFMSEKWSIFYE